MDRLTQSGSHNSLLSLRALTVEYAVLQGGWHSSAAVKAVDGVDLDIQAGKSVGLVGKSGCGKSSVAKAIVGLVKPCSGAILYEGVDLTRASARALKSYRRRIQIIFQDPYSSLNPRRRVGPTLEEPLQIYGLASGLGPSAWLSSSRWWGSIRPCGLDFLMSFPAVRGSASASRELLPWSRHCSSVMSRRPRLMCRCKRKS